jgi:hypothetical protein
MHDDALVRIEVSHELGGTWETVTRLDGRGDPTSTPCASEEHPPGFAGHNDWPQPTGRPTELEPTDTPPEPGTNRLTKGRDG